MITIFRYGILRTLRAALSLYEECYLQKNAKIWRTFISKIEIDKLGPLVGQIVASLLPLGVKCPEMISNIKFIVDKGEQLRDHIKDLHFLQLTG